MKLISNVYKKLKKGKKNFKITSHLIVVIAIISIR